MGGSARVTLIWNDNNLDAVVDAIGQIEALAGRAGFASLETVAMPANNLSVVLRLAS
mgnify:CR=1 FL=1